MSFTVRIPPRRRDGMDAPMSKCCCYCAVCGRLPCGVGRREEEEGLSLPALSPTQDLPPFLA